MLPWSFEILRLSRRVLAVESYVLQLIGILLGNLDQVVGYVVDVWNWRIKETVVSIFGVFDKLLAHLRYHSCIRAIQQIFYLVCKTLVLSRTSYYCVYGCFIQRSWIITLTVITQFWSLYEVRTSVYLLVGCNRLQVPFWNYWLCWRSCNIFRSVTARLCTPSPFFYNRNSAKMMRLNRN